MQQFQPKSNAIYKSLFIVRWLFELSNALKNVHVSVSRLFRTPGIADTDPLLNLTLTLDSFQLSDLFLVEAEIASLNLSSVTHLHPKNEKLPG
mmetsp:Transcript_14378/g.35059  ORF Transcript_14378/g.35059 Transcript_14378/m.35059 type:complete len:93 (+) Transcript_14378:215-493(+)